MCLENTCIYYLIFPTIKKFAFNIINITSSNFYIIRPFERATREKRRKYLPLPSLHILISKMSIIPKTYIPTHDGH